MELHYILQACMTAAVAAVSGGLVGWAGIGLAAKIGLGPRNGGHAPLLCSLRHAAR
jgi:hypothetical protein